jgi:hypothetical protein
MLMTQGSSSSRARLGAWMALAGVALAAGCGGGGGGVEPPPPPPAASCTNDVGNFIGVCTGFPDSGNVDWAGGGDGGAGDGASGDGGAAAGGDFGQFRGVTITAYRNDNGAWVRIGSAPTDDVKGMVTIRPGRTYAGPLLVELTGGPGAQYFEEGKNTFVPFPAGRVIRTIVPRLEHNIGITPFTEAAYQLLTNGSADESVSGPPTPAQIRAANARVATLLNEHFPKALEVRTITRLPFIKSAGVPQGAMGLTDRGIYGIVNGAFSKQAALYNTASTTPTLDAVQQLSEDLRDGKLDGFNANRPAANAGNRSYDPQTLTSELTAALAHQAERFGNRQIQDSLPKLVNFGGTRYEGYLFDSSVSRGRSAFSTVAGWLGANTLNLNVGQANRKNLPPGQSAHSMIGNMGHGGAFFKIDSTDTVNGTPGYRTYALGDNVNGELGTGNTTSTARQLVEITLPGAMTHAAGGFAHTVFRLGDGRVFAVGDNTFGQLGQGSGSTAPARSSTPLEVPLPAFAGGAVAVAATSVASYALMADGSVYAWGSNGGFGLLGNGQAGGTATSPVLVAGLSEIVQISARDNDVVVLKRDQSVWQWGSHPADPGGAYSDGDVTSPYRGGTFTPTQVGGLPSWTVNGRTVAIPVRKILTEQGLFGVLLANGHLYTWGVHFDLSAKAVLRDLTAARVLGAPPLRDLMPGGFNGYGARPFDRMTGLGVDYSGGMWKVRGRVAERFDPDNPALQRRPQTGVPRSANCASCHTFLDETLEQLRARQAAEAPVPAGAPTCLPPSTVHIATNGTSMIRAETECIQCHNPARLDPRYQGQLAPAFAGSGGWPNCNKPTNLPPRDNVPPAPITNSCTIPVGHVFTPPGTVCSSCHNSVAARALQDLNPPCAQPGTNELPTLATTATVVSVTDDDGGATIAQGAYTRDTTPQVNGTLSVALSGSQVLRVLRNGAPAGNAQVSGSSFTFIDTTAPQGTAVYAVRVIEGSGFGALSNSWTVRIDNVAPPAIPSVTSLVDDTFGAIADNGFTTDSTPTLSGSLSAAPDAGDVLQVLRNGTLVGTANVVGTSWTYAEPNPLTAGSYTWAVRLIDAAGNTGASAQRSVNLLGGVAGASIGNVLDDANTTITAGGWTSDSTPALSGTVTAALPTGHRVVVLRNGAAAGTAAVNGTNWSFTDSAPQGAVSYTVRVEAGAVRGADSSAYAFSIDSVAPSQTAAVTQIADRFIGPLLNNATTADQTPTISGTLSSPLGANEGLQLVRTNTGSGVQVFTNLFPSGTAWSFSETALVPSGTYRYEARVFDSAQNASALGAARTVTINPSALPLPGAAATITSIGGQPSGSLINSNTPVVAGTIQRALNAGEVVIVFRNGTALPTPASVTGTNWTFTNGTLADGAYTFTAQVQLASNSGVFGQMSPNATVTIDATAPAQTIAIGGVFDDNSVNVAGNNTSDTTPRISGTLSAALGAGETLVLTRSPGAVNLPITQPAGTSWTYTEAGALAIGTTYTYALRVRDTAGNLSVSNPAQTVTVIAALPNVTGLAVSGATNGFVASLTPQVTGTLSAGVPGGATVRVFRDSTFIGNASVVNTTFFNFTDPANLGQTQRTYTARVEDGTAYGSTVTGVTVTVDTIAPSTTVTLGTNATSSVMPNTVVAGATPANANITNGGTSNDNSPRLTVQLNAALGSNSLRVRRNGAIVTFTNVGSCGTNCFLLDVPSPVTLTNNEGLGGAAITTTVPGTGGLPTATQGFTVSLVDLAGNEGTASAAFNIVFNYFDCDFTRANATHNTFQGQPHQAWASTLNCASCHTTGQANQTTPTPSGTMVRVPASFSNPPVSSYWCRRP